MHRKVRSEYGGKKEIPEDEEGQPHGEEVQVTGRDGMSNPRGQAERTNQKGLQAGRRKLGRLEKARNIFQVAETLCQ